LHNPDMVVEQNVVCISIFAKTVLTLIMKWLIFALALVAPSQAGLRFGCSSLSIQRIDPLVEPGNVPSAHVHQISVEMYFSRQ